MAHKITEDCIACGACEPECPNEAISEGDPYYIIDAVKCKDCVGDLTKSGKTHCEDVCPVDVCVPI